VNDRIEPADAARALSEIARRREQVIRRTAVPRWFWWASAVLAIMLAADTESQHGALLWTGIALFTAGTLAINVLLFRAVRRAPLRPDLEARSVPGVLAGAAALVAVVFGVALGTKLSLEAAGVPYPGMIASAAAMAVLVAGGQMLMRYRTAFLVRRPGGRG
jgi:hydrogenase-4 membrane subunit HyfE